MFMVKMDSFCSVQPTDAHLAHYLRLSAGRGTLSQRAKVLRSALNAASNLRTSVAIARHAVSHSERHTSGPDMLLEPGSDLDPIKAVIVMKIRNASSAAGFADDAELVLSLQMWKVWGGTNEPMQWATALCGSSSGLLKFLRAFQTVSRSQGSGPLVKQHEFFVLANLEEFVDLNVLRVGTGKINHELFDR
jgi:hypothetical protein